jgi:hypothetical protein
VYENTSVLDIQYGSGSRSSVRITVRPNDTIPAFGLDAATAVPTGTAQQRAAPGAAAAAVGGVGGGVPVPPVLAGGLRGIARATINAVSEAMGRGGNGEGKAASFGSGLVGRQDLLLMAKYCLHATNAYTSLSTKKLDSHFAPLHVYSIATPPLTPEQVF